MLRVGLTGGIGSGKSEVSARLAARGAVVIDADKIAREVVEPGTPGLSAVVAEFGQEVLLPDGSMDREKVGSIVFADAGRRAALNAIVHPLVGERMQELMAAAPGDAIVVYDVPLLAENGLKEMYDVVVVVDVPEETQLERLTGRRGMTERDARARIAAQASRQDRLAIADHVIDNSGTLRDLDARVEALWADLAERAAAA
ncbi:dephospho-CoA kinase [Thermomonospora echinospora]|uniref:Dephospho-CoA kinase n=1 Tax=Thermomonospora echinospora TaxID=1992 RepID=A0A1H5SUH4_9ACTN|nr:dephospho-CoA kinase [Thermomonospora echinospora]SEF54150.1 dephospho-CoA kinase [Thermomonospora echinospora]